MSYGGYDELLCAAGHRRVFDYYASYELSSLSDLCSCGQSFVFRHCVDETNCDGEPYPFEVDEPEDTATCNMGHVHVTREVRYKIPQPAQVKGCGLPPRTRRGMGSGVRHPRAACWKAKGDSAMTPPDSTEWKAEGIDLSALARELLDTIGIGYGRDYDTKLRYAEAALVRVQQGMGGGWRCKARVTADPPEDCDWPNCGCDPYAEKVLTALEEQAPGLFDVMRNNYELRADVARLRGELEQAQRKQKEADTHTRMFARAADTEKAEAKYWRERAEQAERDLAQARADVRRETLEEAILHVQVMSIVTGPRVVEALRRLREDAGESKP